MSITKEELSQKIDCAPWDLLRAHLERGTLIIISNDLDLADVAYAVATDEKESVERWVMNKLLIKPSAEQIREWDANKQKLFHMVVISPFILIQAFGIQE